MLSQLPAVYQPTLVNYLIAVWTEVLIEVLSLIAVVFLHLEVVT